MKRAAAAAVLTLLTIASAPAHAQVPQPPAAQRAAIAKLAHWAGDWRGAGWAMTGRDQRTEFTVDESVRLEIQGSVLVAKGVGRSRLPGGEEAVTHEALGVLSYDDRAGAYRFRTHDLRGVARDAEFRVTDTGAVWGFRDEERNADLRFTIVLQGDRWHEVGEVSIDGGQRWFRVLEMTLARVK